MKVILTVIFWTVEETTITFFTKSSIVKVAQKGFSPSVFSIGFHLAVYFEFFNKLQHTFTLIFINYGFSKIDQLNKAV